MDKVKILLLAISAAGVLSSCAEKGFSPSPSPNPWDDDYSAFIQNPEKWGTYNVHDPCVRKFGDTYYAYSTDAVFFAPPKEGEERKPIKMGNIQMRKSKDLVNWDFLGWAFDSIPSEAWNYVYPISGDKTSRGLWAPFVYNYKGVYRMYYCLSTFGKKVSYIGLAESANPEGPWQHKGCVVKTDDSSVMNAIDPTIIEDAENHRLWMIYGSFFGGIFAMELNPETGLALNDGDQGHLVAHRANYKRDNMEAPEVVYNPETKKYYLFVSYGPLVTTYNVRVLVADHPEGPYQDYFGTDPRNEVNTLPILTAPYRFESHPGWAGLAHCSVFNDGEGNYYIASQGRLQPENMMMDLHIRRLMFNADGWPLVSPERYAGEKDITLNESDLYGVWEIITIKDNEQHRTGADGQVTDNHLLPEETNVSKKIEILSSNIQNFSNNTFDLEVDNNKIKGVKVFAGHDWELKTNTLVFSAVDSCGFSLWGKKVK